MDSAFRYMVSEVSQIHTSRKLNDVAEVVEFLSESSGEDSEQLPSTSPASSLTTMANFQIPPPDILELQRPIGKLGSLLGIITGWLRS